MDSSIRFIYKNNFIKTFWLNKLVFLLAFSVKRIIPNQNLNDLGRYFAEKSSLLSTIFQDLDKKHN